MVLNMAQTWHQVRPGEIRNDCGGCHAHSQKPTRFKHTAAAKPDYAVFDLTEKTPLLTTKANDQSGKKWDAKDETGLRFEKGVKNVEFYRDVKPILDRSCVACHTQKADEAGRQPRPRRRQDREPARLPTTCPAPTTAWRWTTPGAFGHKPLDRRRGGDQNASRYVRMFQSRRSLLIWKIFGERLDGLSNDDFPTETAPGDPSTLQLKGQPVPNTPREPQPRRPRLHRQRHAAAGGRSKAGQGQAALTDEDRLTLVRWIDLGCPIDLDYDPTNPKQRGYGWMLDDQRPTLTLTSPKAGANPPLDAHPGRHARLRHRPGHGELPGGRRLRGRRRAGGPEPGARSSSRRRAGGVGVDAGDAAHACRRAS